jgi:hypothetical protein
MDAGRCSAPRGTGQRWVLGHLAGMGLDVAIWRPRHYDEAGEWLGRASAPSAVQVVQAFMRAWSRVWGAQEARAWPQQVIWGLDRYETAVWSERDGEQLEGWIR